jgi:recombination protein RecT
MSNEITQHRQQLEKYFANPEFANKLIQICGNEKEYQNAVARTILFVINNQALQNIPSAQIFKLAMQSYELGIPLNSEKLSYVVNFGGAYQLIPTAKGFIRKTLQNKNIKDIRCNIIYQDDFFEYGDNSKDGVYYEYKANMDSDKHGDILFIKGCFTVIDYKDGNSKIEYMSKKQLDTIKGKAKTKNVWNEFAEEMCKKAVLKRALKNESLPELQDIIEIDNKLYDMNKVVVEKTIDHSVFETEEVKDAVKEEVVEEVVVNNGELI